jgi:hypothetical protein
MDAARNINTAEETTGHVRELLSGEASPSKEFMAKVLERSLDVR